MLSETWMTANAFFTFIHNDVPKSVQSWWRSAVPRLLSLILMYYSVIAQRVERPTEKPGAILTRVRVSGAARDFFSQSQLSMQTLWRCPYSSLCATAYINICAHVKNPKHWQPHHCQDTRKYCTHRQEWVALFFAAAVLYPSKATWISRKGQSRCIFSARPHPASAPVSSTELCGFRVYFERLKC